MLIALSGSPADGEEIFFGACLSTESRRTSHDSSMRDSWQRRIDRATELANADEGAGSLLAAYVRLLHLQHDCDQTLRRDVHGLTGSLDRDLPAVRRCVAPMLRSVAATGPPTLAEEAQRLLGGDGSATDAIVLDGWHVSSASFFAKLVLQPYAECLADSGIRPSGRGLPPATVACPFCGGPPQLSILQNAGDADGGGRMLLCATCSTRWPFRRVLCAHCGEEDERRLGYFHAPEYPHLRVDACDTCLHYLKSVDLTRLGIAVPVVDEMAGAALDVWARERGYDKIELNLVGL